MTKPKSFAEAFLVLLLVNLLVSQVAVRKTERPKSDSYSDLNCVWVCYDCDRVYRSYRPKCYFCGTTLYREKKGESYGNPHYGT